MIFNRPRRQEKGYTYRFNDLSYVAATSARYAVKFRSGENKTNFIALTVQTAKKRITRVIYETEDGSPYDAYISSYGGWVREAYRTVTFNEEPTGELLVFLQKAATPQ